VADHHQHSVDHSHALPAGDAVLRARGRRLTRQRRMIWEVLAAEPDDVIGDLPDRVDAASGYALARRELTLFGLCPDCRAR
jgi:Fe2+ or Zn2+ uptake regulation protein